MYIPPSALHKPEPTSWAGFEVKTGKRGTYRVLRLHSASGIQGLVAMKPAPTSWNYQTNAIQEAQGIRAWLRQTVPSETYRALRKILKEEEV